MTVRVVFVDDQDVMRSRFAAPESVRCGGETVCPATISLVTVILCHGHRCLGRVRCGVPGAAGYRHREYGCEERGDGEGVEAPVKRQIAVVDQGQDPGAVGWADDGADPADAERALQRS